MSFLQKIVYKLKLRLEGKRATSGFLFLATPKVNSLPIENLPNKTINQANKETDRLLLSGNNTTKQIKQEKVKGWGFFCIPRQQTKGKVDNNLGLMTFYRF